MSLGESAWKQRLEQGVTIVTINLAHLDTSTAKPLAEFLSSLLPRCDYKLVIDMVNVESILRSVAHALCASAKICRDNGGSIVLCNLQVLVADLCSRLDREKLLCFVADRETAIRSFTKPDFWTGEPKLKVAKPY